MGPVANWKRKMAAMMVVTFESKMAVKAREKPCEIELMTPLPRASSSLILSQMRTLASAATHAGPEPRAEGVGAEGRADRPLLEVLDARRQGAGLEDHDQVVGLFGREPAAGDGALGPQDPVFD